MMPAARGHAGALWLARGNPGIPERRDAPAWRHDDLAEQEVTGDGGRIGEGYVSIDGR